MNKKELLNKLYIERNELEEKATKIGIVLTSVEKQIKLKLDSMDLFHLDIQLLIIRLYISILESRICYIQYYKKGDSDEQSEDSLL